MIMHESQPMKKRSKKMTDEGDEDDEDAKIFCSL